MEYLLIFLTFSMFISISIGISIFLARSNRFWIAFPGAVALSVLANMLIITSVDSIRRGDLDVFTDGWTLVAAFFLLFPVTLTCAITLAIAYDRKSKNKQA